MAQRFLQHIHDFRTVAILVIVGTHTLPTLTWDDGSLTYRLLDALINQSSIWFIFIAGLLFQHLSDRFNFQKYLTGKFKFIIIPYVLMSIIPIYLSIFYFQHHFSPAFYEKPVWEQVTLYLLTGHQMAPFWFIPTITLIYFLAPFFIWADRVRWPYLLLPAAMLFSLLIGREGVQLWAEWGDKASYLSPISKAFYLFSVYWFGVFCGRYHDEVIAFVGQHFWPLTAVCVAGYVTTVQMGLGGIDIYGLLGFHPIFLFKVTSAVIVFYLMARFNSLGFSRLKLVGEVSFGVFFIHAYFLQAFRLGAERFGYAEYMQGSAVGFVLWTAFITALSVVAILGIQWLFKKRARYITGTFAVRGVPAFLASGLGLRPPAKSEARQSKDLHGDVSAMRTPSVH